MKFHQSFWLLLYGSLTLSWPLNRKLTDSLTCQPCLERFAKHWTWTWYLFMQFVTQRESASVIEMFVVGCSSCGVTREAEAIKYPSISPRKLCAGREVHLGSRQCLHGVTQTTSAGKPLSAQVSTQTERLDCANNSGTAHRGLLYQLIVYFGTNNFIKSFWTLQTISKILLI